ncbi:cytochrome c [Chitinophaga sp. CB10]|uniref:c-type cytochrome n=1 Tax=Chitinophaga sp. CB10 TaxID=1891659 RepID=UPI0025BC007A|nr:cytochrome c [Chitinophaga sp. CB10]
MKTGNMLIYLLAAGLLAACASRKSEPVKQREFSPTGRVARGEEIYMVYCDKCHPGGEAGLGPAISSNPAPQFIKRFQMRHGLGVMPSFKKEEISKKDLRDISKYLHAWKHY